MAVDVRSTIVIEGQDQFSAVFGKLERGAKGAADSLGGMAGKSGDIAERAGDLERGFLGLKDIIGGIGDGPLAAVADRMGGIEGVLKGFGPGMGAVGLAIGAAAMGAGLLYDRLEAARKAGIQSQIDELSKAQSDKELLAQRYGLTREMLGLAEKATGLKGVQLQIDKEVTQIAALEAEILKKQLDGETEGIARREAAIRAGRERTSQLMLQVEKEKQVSAEQEKRKALQMFLADSAASMVERERAAELIADRRAQINAKTAILADKRALAESRIAELERSQASVLTRTVAGMTELLGLREKLFGIAKEEQAVMASAEALLAEKQAAQRAAAERARERRKAADEARRKALDDYYAAENQLSEKLQKDAADRAASILTLQDQIRKQAIESASDPAARARLALQDAEVRYLREKATVQEQLAGDDERRALRMLELDGRIAAERAVIRASEVKASDDAAAKARAEAAAKIDSAMGVASAAVAGLEQIGAGERAAAGMKAILAAAEAGLAAARGNYAGAIAGAFSAMQFGKLALTGGGEKVPGVGGGHGTGFASGAVAQGGTGRDGGGAVVINFNKGFYGDAASTAKGIAKTMKTISNSGIPASKGA